MLHLSLSCNRKPFEDSSLKEHFRPSVSNIMSANVRMTMELRSGQFWHNIGQCHEMY